MMNNQKLKGSFDDLKKRSLFSIDFFVCSSITIGELPIEKPKTPPPVQTRNDDDDDSSDEEFDVAWERRAKLKARKEAAAAAPPPPKETPTKRSVHFPPSVHDRVDVIELEPEQPLPPPPTTTTTENNDLVIDLDDEDENATQQSQLTTVCVSNCRCYN